MRKKILGLVIIMIFTLAICGCHKNKKAKKVVVTPDNAKLFTYDYLVTLVGKDKLPKMTYAYPLEELVEVTAYRGLVLDESSNITVSDEEVGAFIDVRKKEYATREVRNDGKVAKDDILVVSIEGTLDGNPIGGAFTDYEYKLGGNMIDELDERLVGVKVGETFDMPSTFSEEYANAEYAGKSVNFTITVNGVVTYTYPEENQEFYERMADDHEEEGLYTDSASFENYVRNKLLAKKIDAYKEALYEEAWQKALENTNVKNVPTFDYESAYDQAHDGLEKMYKENGADFQNVDEYLNACGYEKNEDELSKDAANMYVKEKLCTLYIAKKENIEVSEEEYTECVLGFATQYGFADADEFLKAIGDARYAFLLERYYEVLYNKVRKIVME